MMLGQTASPWFKASRLEILITNACDPSAHEPNFAHHLEIAEYINIKKANTPREAAMLIARLANHRNPHIALLSLALLDTLVQSCGYPFHLQIATKEFLNELVRRFPERPPPFPGPVMSRILEVIHSWKEGICTESRWKEDLGNIRDMHRLLTFKGYRFRELPSRNLAEPTLSLKTAEELENEDREAQSAKLQELIRRGTPRDLAAAQELMKSLAGANPDAKPDYRAQALAELAKFQSKVVLLNEMLDNVDAERGEKFAKGDAYDQVAAILISARPKLQKWVSDAESDDPESLNAFLEANDQINTALARFEAFQRGDYNAIASIPTSVYSTSPGGTNGGASLIDFDDGPSASGSGVGNNGNLVDDLANLFNSPAPSSQPPPVNNATRPVISSPFPISAPEQPPLQGPQYGSIMLPASRKASPSGSYFGSSTSPPPAVGLGHPMRAQSPPQPNSTSVGLSGGSQFFSAAQPKTQFQRSSTGSRFSGGMSIQQRSLQSTPSSQPRSGDAQNRDPFADLAGLF
ncbi:VHS-domain-containing protein [Pisolithus orientalis]|uniref:VHS-domain-containing protein n=1 Tax=Pisolithus orientalis TaxID=936130 RepID=UPI0022247288|nr:VHS-domain-containing protein [Pisolithus orientalis]KAI6032709.1 VHS-domain-containing protein [Pisolithus orientalis]